jgi:hypothetical protein
MRPRSFFPLGVSSGGFASLAVRLTGRRTSILGFTRPRLVVGGSMLAFAFLVSLRLRGTPPLAVAPAQLSAPLA